MRVRYSRYIETDLEEIAEYIARDNPVRALSFVQELRAEMSRIARNPRAYRVRPELGPGIGRLQGGNTWFFSELTRISSAFCGSYTGRAI